MKMVVSTNYVTVVLHNTWKLACKYYTSFRVQDTQHTYTHPNIPVLLDCICKCMCMLWALDSQVCM